MMRTECPLLANNCGGQHVTGKLTGHQHHAAASISVKTNNSKHCIKVACSDVTSTKQHDGL